MTPIEIRTPEFLAWSLRIECKLRQDTRNDDPLQVEKRLRPVRCWRDSVALGQVIDGIGVRRVSRTNAPPNWLGFPIAETLQFYGGETAIDQACAKCQANLCIGGSKEMPQFVAGCYGLVSSSQKSLADLCERALRAVDLPEIESASTTRPRWYGLWRADAVRPNSEVLASLLTVMEDHLAVDSEDSNDELLGLRRFRQAVIEAAQHDLKLDVSLMPAGRVCDRQWIVDPHCGRCLAPANSDQARCHVCGSTASAVPAQTRRARGMRPYLPLEVFLGRDRADALVDRLAKSSAPTLSDQQWHRRIWIGR